MTRMMFLSFLVLVLILASGCGKEKIDTKVVLEDISFKNITGQGKIIARGHNPQYYGQVEGIKMFSDIKKIIDRGKINIGVYDIDCAPFVMKDDSGKLYGLDIEIAKGFAQLLGVEANFISLGNRTDNIFKKLCCGEVDLAIGQISNCFIRSTCMFFSSTYVHLKQALIVYKQDLISLGIEDNPYQYMKDHKFNLGVVNDGAYIEFAHELFPKAIVIEYPKRKDVIEGLKKHEIMAIMDDNNTLAILAMKYPEIALLTNMYVLENREDNIAVAVSPSSPNLLNCINVYLENRSFCFELNDLMLKYLEEYK